MTKFRFAYSTPKIIGTKEIEANSIEDALSKGIGFLNPSLVLSSPEPGKVEFAHNIELHQPLTLREVKNYLLNFYDYSYTLNAI